MNDRARLDPEGMFDAIRSFPDHLQEGRRRALPFEAPFTAAGKQQVVVVGMGGSAIGGDLLRTLALPHAAVPVSVVRHYTLPASVGADTIVVVSSYSGNTEETLSALDEALARGAKVACIAAGGQVLARAEAEGLPYVQIPGGLQPRAALGYSLGALLTMAERLELHTIPPSAWEEAHERLLRQREVYSAEDNEARDLAASLKGLLPFVYSESGLLEAVNLRWRCQFNENSKALAGGNLFPELNHNEIMGWDQPDDLFERIAVIVLRDLQEHPRVQQRIEVTRGLLEPKAARWIEVKSEGEHPFTRVLSLVHLGDWVSLYLAYRRGVDPTPVGLIQQLKQALG